MAHWKCSDFNGYLFVVHVSAHGTTLVLGYVEGFKWLQTLFVIDMWTVEQVHFPTSVIRVVAYRAIFIPSLQSLVLNILPKLIKFGFLFSSLVKLSLLLKFSFSLLHEYLSHVGNEALEKLLSVLDTLVNFMHHIHDGLSLLIHLISLLLSYSTQFETNELLS